MSVAQGGYWKKILEINLSAGKISTLVPEEALYSDYLGGSGIAAKLLYDLTDEKTDPLGEENPLIYMTGPFTGTRVPTSGRHQITAKSPLTGIFGEGDAGGAWGAMLKKAGWDGIIITGKAQSPVYIVIENEHVRIEDAQKLWGRSTFDTEDAIRELHGKKTEVSCIGPAGERLTPVASIAQGGEDARMVGRCGLGAVMGSKKLKAIAVIGDKNVPIADPERFDRQQKAILPQIVENTKAMNLLGTAGGTVGAEKSGDLPIQNWRRGGWSEVEQIGGQRMADTILKKNYYCSSCPIGCGRHVEITEGAYAQVCGAGPEYETLGMMGGACLVSDLNAITYAADLCNRAGLDTIEAGSAIAMIMECYEQNLISLEELDGIDAAWGSATALVELTRKLCDSEGVGKLLGLGVRGIAQKLGKGSEEYAIHVKGLALPAHDPRCFNSMAVGYATSNRGACHLQGASYFFEKTATMPELGYTQPQAKHEEKGKGKLNFHAQNIMAILDSLKMCKFALYGGVHLKEMREWIASVIGREISQEELLAIGERIYNLKRMYNVRCGITAKDDTLPERILKTPRKDEGTGEYLPSLDNMLKEYYQERGWDSNGIPSKETLLRLGLAQTELIP